MFKKNNLDDRNLKSLLQTIKTHTNITMQILKTHGMVSQKGKEIKDEGLTSNVVETLQKFIGASFPCSACTFPASVVFFIFVSASGRQDV